MGNFVQFLVDIWKKIKRASKHSKIKRINFASKETDYKFKESSITEETFEKETKKKGN